MVSFSVNSSSRAVVAIEIILAQLAVVGADDDAPWREGDLAQQRPFDGGAPGPAVAEPERRQELQLGRFRPAVVDRDLDQHVLGAGLGIFDEDVEITVLVEDPGIDQLIFEAGAPARRIGFDQILIGVAGLRIFVEIFHVGVGRRAVEVEVVFLDVLAVIAFGVGEAEEPLLQDRVLPVPERQREAEPLLAVGDSRDPILAPAIGPRAGLVMAEIIPGVAVRAVVLAHRPPLPLAEIGAPFPPGLLLFPGFAQAIMLGSHLGLIPQGFGAG